MSIAIISSTNDKASTNIKNSLLGNFNFKEAEEKYGDNPIYSGIIEDKKIKVYTINSDLIHGENIDNGIDADLFLFISKHRAKEERKRLLCNQSANFGKRGLA